MFTHHPRRLLLLTAAAGLTLTACARNPKPAPSAPEPAAQAELPPATGNALRVPGTNILMRRTFAETTSTRYPTQRIEGELTMAQLREIAPRVARLEATPAELVIAVGDTLRFLDGLVVTAIDSAGVSLGRIHRFSFRMMSGAARIVPPVGIEGIKEGTSSLQISFPNRLITSEEQRGQLEIPIKVTKKSR